MKPPISFIGAGNVATHLARAFYAEGYRVSQICSRNLTDARTLAAEVNAEATDDAANIRDEEGILIIAIPDDAIREVAVRLKFKNLIVTHTSGSTSIGNILDMSDNYGVIYPLQTFSRTASLDLSGVPFLIEANNEKTEKLLTRLASDLSERVENVNSETRALIHLAAVFANNFANHLVVLASKILNDTGHDHKILLPLLQQTVKKLEKLDPEEAQTGPAVRGDQKVIRKQLRILNDHPEIKKVYEVLTESIVRRSGTDFPKV